MYVNDKLCISEVSEQFYFLELKPHNHNSGNVDGPVHHSLITSTNMLYNSNTPKHRRSVSSSRSGGLMCSHCGGAHTPSQKTPSKQSAQYGARTHGAIQTSSACGEV